MGTVKNCPLKERCYSILIMLKERFIVTVVFLVYTINVLYEDFLSDVIHIEIIRYTIPQKKCPILLQMSLRTK